MLPAFVTSRLPSLSPPSNFRQFAKMSTAASNPATYKFNHTMFRIRDPKVSLPFYEKVLGMKVNNFHLLLYNENRDLTSSRFSTSPPAVISPTTSLPSPTVSTTPTSTRKASGTSSLTERVFLSSVTTGVLVSRTSHKYFGSLLLNLNTENDANFKGYASGNEEPGRGFGHICITVDNLEAACKRFDELGVKFKKRPEEGRMRVSETSFYLIGRGVLDSQRVEVG